VEANRQLGLKVIGRRRAPGEATIATGRPILGTTDELGRIFQERVGDEVAICLSISSEALADPIVRIATDQGQDRPGPLPTGDRAAARRPDGGVRGRPRPLVCQLNAGMGLAVKRLMDIGGAAIGLVLLSPIVLVGAGRPLL
jgi:hypothetical protein